MDKLVSVLIPVYNGQKYLIEFLDSIYHQTYRPLKLIISDDASSDNSVKVIEQWIKDKEDREFIIQFIKNRKNSGLSSNINSMVHLIEGDYVFMADQDDIWNKEKIKCQVDYLERNEDCFFCFCDRSIINENGILLKKSEAEYLQRIFTKRSYSQLIHNNAMYSANRMAFRNKYLDKLFPLPVKICEHDIFITIMGAHFGKVGYLHKQLLRYRIHSNSVSQNYFVETSSDLIKCYNGFIRLFEKVNRCSKIDSRYIRKVVKTRFSEVLPEDSVIFRKTVRHIYLKAVKETIAALTTGKLNSFYQ